MKKPLSFNPKKILLVVVSIIAASLVFVVAIGVTLYAWPLDDDRLRIVRIRDLSYDEAYARHIEAAAAEKDVPEDCRSQVKTHGHKTAKVVVLLHGFDRCAKQFTQLADHFFQKGYNVYTPTAMSKDQKRAHAQLSAPELVTHANEAVNTATGLGDEVGVVGVSGGGVLATWLAQYRSDAVQRLLLISPLYAPSAKQVPTWMLKPISVLYGYNVLADQTTPGGMSLYALARYHQIVANYQNPMQKGKLKSVAVVVSPGDDITDPDKAVDIPLTLAVANGLSLLKYTPPAEWNLGYDIVQALDNAHIKDKAAPLYQKYFNLYEGRED